MIKLLLLISFAVATPSPEAEIKNLDPAKDPKVLLGKQLFFDGRLSKNGKVSCNSCHNVMKAGEDHRAVSVGVEGKTGNRNSPTVFNAAAYSVQFWDGRAATLEDQAKGPMLNPVEMAMPSHDAVVNRLKKIPGYVTQFQQVFGQENPLTIDNVASAIATYERTLTSLNSPYDKYLAGNKSALSPKAKKGLELVTSHGCTGCHTGPNFSGPEMKIGEGFYQKFPMFPGSEYDKRYDLVSDAGRFEVTKNEADRNMWRVPTWRNVARTAPYFHNGKVKSLHEAVRVMAKTQLNKTLPFQEVSSIVDFLESLNGEYSKQTVPKLPIAPKEILLE